LQLQITSVAFALQHTGLCKVKGTLETL